MTAASESTKHTAGKWEAVGVEIVGTDGVIAQCGFGMRDDAETHANARLIAAAPLLLEAAEYEEDSQRLTGAALMSDIDLVVAIVEKYPTLLHQDMLAETAAFVLNEAATAKRRRALAAARGEGSAQ